MARGRWQIVSVQGSEVRLQYSEKIFYFADGLFFKRPILSFKKGTGLHSEEHGWAGWMDPEHLFINVVGVLPGKYKMGPKGSSHLINNEGLKDLMGRSGGLKYSQKYMCK